jgi:hypothetical protein
MSNYKTAQNLAIVTHANTVLGQFNITNTASARCLYIPFHKKEILTHSQSWQTALEEITVHPCAMISLEFQHTHTPLL